MKLILVDPKQVEMAPYQDIPHLLTPVIVEPEKTISALKWAVNEMERRYSLLAEEKVRDIKSYNEKVKNKTVGVEDEDGNIYECAFFNRHTRQWDYSESGYWWDECYIQANLDVHNLSEQEALALVGTV